MKHKSIGDAVNPCPIYTRRKLRILVRPSQYAGFRVDFKIL
ncbi:hypothetical protein [Arthrobacter sp. B1I2]|nr:hypothetical protein [Arthrobacter sp. B1I2]MDQ0733091.1 hypothetical protein [Arthrobacter sp. B1I2]